MSPPRCLTALPIAIILATAFPSAATQESVVGKSAESSRSEAGPRQPGQSESSPIRNTLQPGDVVDDQDVAGTRLPRNEPVDDRPVRQSESPRSDSPLVWPSIPDGHDIPLAAIDLVTKLRWTLAFLLPSLAASDLPLHVYPSTVLDDQDLFEHTAKGWPLFAVLELQDDARWVARHFRTPGALRAFTAALAELDPDTASRIYVATPLPLPGQDQIDTFRGEFARPRAPTLVVQGYASRSGATEEPVRSFDEIYRRYPATRPYPL